MTPPAPRGALALAVVFLAVDRLAVSAQARRSLRLELPDGPCAEGFALSFPGTEVYGQ